MCCCLAVVGALWLVSLATLFVIGVVGFVLCLIGWTISGPGIVRPEQVDNLSGQYREIFWLIALFYITVASTVLGVREFMRRRLDDVEGQEKTFGAFAQYGTV